MTTPSQRPRLALAILSLLFIFARQRAVLHPDLPATAVAPQDIFSVSEPQKVVVRHLSLDLDVDFTARQLRGSATLQIENLSGTRQLLLDTRQLDISAVSVDGQSAMFAVGAESMTGAPLAIGIESTTRQTITIHYSTHPSARGLHWMNAAQSFGRKSPYLYSQNEPDDARSWIPIQDTPTVRMTYDATVRVPSGMLALMSAENPIATRSDGIYTFRMPQPIPAYLICLAVARLEFRPLDSRTGVYAEPELMDDAVWELQYVPRMLDAAERIAGRYPWGRYDILLMPPTYVFGGMEHPRLNFLNPFETITGNHPAQPQPVDLVAHEMAHSWAGNLATLASWNDVWINEGIATYLAQRIIEEMGQPERAEYAFFQDRADYARFADNSDPEASRLHRPLKIGDRALAGFGITSYLKGRLFMQTLETRIGRAEFDRFLVSYFADFAFRWVDDRAFLEYLRGKILAGRPQLEEELHLDEWVYGMGLPANMTAPTSSSLFDRVQSAAARFASGTPLADLGIDGWTDIEVNIFLDVANEAIFSRMAEVDAFFSLSSRPAPPLSWLLLAIASKYSPADAAIDRVLMRGGPNGSIFLLYALLASDPLRKPAAAETYARLRERYDPSIQFLLDGLLSDNARTAAASWPVADRSLRAAVPRRRCGIEPTTASWSPRGKLPPSVIAQAHQKT